jgi:mono/diheme cytochrome c family protein
MKTRIFLAVVGLAVAFSATAFAQDAKQVAAGKALFDSNKCATCHQIAGKGNKMFPLDGVGSKLSAAEIKAWLTDPAAQTAKLPKKPPIPMKKYDLKDAEVASLVAYLSSLKK